MKEICPKKGKTAKFNSHKIWFFQFFLKISSLRYSSFPRLKSSKTRTDNKGDQTHQHTWYTSYSTPSSFSRVYEWILEPIGVNLFSSGKRLVNSSKLETKPASKDNEGNLFLLVFLVLLQQQRPTWSSELESKIFIWDGNASFFKIRRQSGKEFATHCFEIDKTGVFNKEYYCLKSMLGRIFFNLFTFWDYFCNFW